MTVSSHDSQTSAAADAAIRPFHIEFPQDAVDDLRRRISATRWPERETVDDDSQGVQLETMQDARPLLGRATTTRRPFEARLNELPKFITEIDGLDIHFIHVRSAHENALPLIVTHGWPGSVIELMKSSARCPTRRPTAARAATPSTSSFPHCRDTGSPRSRPRRGGIRYAPQTPGSC